MECRAKLWANLLPSLLLWEYSNLVKEIQKVRIEYITNDIWVIDNYDQKKKKTINGFIYVRVTACLYDWLLFCEEEVGISIN